MNEGYIYIISNPHYKGFLKIGRATNTKSRLGNYQTASPKRDYKIEHKVLLPDCISGEKLVHEKLKMFALSKRNEWFEIDLQIAINMVDSLLINEENPIEDMFTKYHQAKFS